MSFYEPISRSLNWIQLTFTHSSSSESLLFKIGSISGIFASPWVISVGAFGSDKTSVTSRCPNGLLGLHLIRSCVNFVASKPALRVEHDDTVLLSGAGSPIVAPEACVWRTNFVFVRTMASRFSRMVPPSGFLLGIGWGAGECSSSKCS